MKASKAPAWYTVLVILWLGATAQASLGDRLPDFKACVHVGALFVSCSARLTARIGLRGGQLRRKPDLHS